MDRAGLVGITPHTLRHSHASVANDLGYTDPTIAAMPGHASQTTTGLYIHHLDPALLAAADRVAESIYDQMVGTEEGLLSQQRGATTPDAPSAKA